MVHFGQNAVLYQSMPKTIWLYAHMLLSTSFSFPAVPDSMLAARRAAYTAKYVASKLVKRRAIRAEVHCL